MEREAWGVDAERVLTVGGKVNFCEGEVGDVEEDVVGGRRCVLRNTASEGVRGMSRSGRLAASASAEEREEDMEDEDEPGKSKALKTEGLLSSKKVCPAGAGG